MLDAIHHQGADDSSRPLILEMQFDSAPIPDRSASAPLTFCDCR